MLGENHASGQEGEEMARNSPETSPGRQVTTNISTDPLLPVINPDIRGCEWRNC